ncbi:MAG: ATP-binding cassette domain-containing protein [Treponema sp.]|jgi:simple sugar transport system ATP-binding protein|nr:ATP-binding cassette domain-containing protein [Treponema sp.]
MVLLHKIHKRFTPNGVKALDGADFELREGEIHALVGENGAGKSTLMHIMAGFLKASEGVIIADGQEMVFSSPAKALAAGIGMVRQHPRMVQEFSVWENCVLGVENSLWFSKRCAKEIAALNERWNFGLPLEKPASALTVSQGQKAAILGLLRRDVTYLVFDEPTAVLSPPETESLFELFRKLRDEGKGIALISHKLNETLSLADRVTVLRRGKTAGTLNAGEAEEGRLSALIFGVFRRENSAEPSAGAFFNSPPALELKNVTVQVPGRPLIRGINLRVPPGGIVGIGGVRDSGLETLEMAVTGYLPLSGTITVNGKELDGGFHGFGKNIRPFRDAGGSYLGTHAEGAVESGKETGVSMRDILVIHAHRRFQKYGFLQTRRLAAWSKRIVRGAGVAGPDTILASAFSGGQLQRILFMRELAEKKPLLVLAEPGRGLDQKSKNKLAVILRERAAAGTGILIFSTDSEELLSVCDTVIVLRNGVFSDTVAIRPSGETTGSAEPDETADSAFRAADPRALLERIQKAMVGEG